MPPIKLEHDPGGCRQGVRLELAGHVGTERVRHALLHGIHEVNDPDPGGKEAKSVTGAFVHLSWATSKGRIPNIGQDEVTFRPCLGRGLDLLDTVLSIDGDVIRIGRHAVARLLADDADLFVV